MRRLRFACWGLIGKLLLTPRRHGGGGLRQPRCPGCGWDRGLSCVRRESWLQQDGASGLRGGSGVPPASAPHGDLWGSVPESLIDFCVGTQDSLSNIEDLEERSQRTF